MVNIIGYQCYLYLTEDYWFSWHVTLLFHLEIGVSNSSSGCLWHCKGHGNNSRTLFLYFKWHPLNFKCNLNHWRQTNWHKGQRSLPASQTKRLREKTNPYSVYFPCWGSSSLLESSGAFSVGAGGACWQRSHSTVLPFSGSVSFQMYFINRAIKIFLPFQLASHLRIWTWHPASFLRLTQSSEWGTWLW